MKFVSPIKCQCCPHIETTANQLTGFYIRATLALNGLSMTVKNSGKGKVASNILILRGTAFTIISIVDLEDFFTEELTMTKA